VRGAVPGSAERGGPRVRAFGSNGHRIAVPKGHRDRRHDGAGLRPALGLRAGGGEAERRRRVLRRVLVAPRRDGSRGARGRFGPPAGAVPRFLPAPTPTVGSPAGASAAGPPHRRRRGPLGHARSHPGPDPSTGVRLQDGPRMAGASRGHAVLRAAPAPEDRCPALSGGHLLPGFGGVAGRGRGRGDADTSGRPGGHGRCVRGRAAGRSSTPADWGRTLPVVPAAIIMPGGEPLVRRGGEPGIICPGSVATAR
jgi:hypothetical protein